MAWKRRGIDHVDENSKQTQSTNTTKQFVFKIVICEMNINDFFAQLSSVPQIARGIQVQGKLD